MHLPRTTSFLAVLSSLLFTAQLVLSSIFVPRQAVVSSFASQAVGTGTTNTQSRTPISTYTPTLSTSYSQTPISTYTVSPATPSDATETRTPISTYTPSLSIAISQTPISMYTVIPSSNMASAGGTSQGSATTTSFPSATPISTYTVSSSAYTIYAANTTGVAPSGNSWGGKTAEGARGNMLGLIAVLVFALIV